jgi:2-polyprenyl-3-methyl-5-hydroxy-6-metoxy-1,4-benzoquinol methylase
MPTPPGPRSRIPFRYLRTVQRDPIPFFTRLVREYGDASQFHVGRSRSSFSIIRNSFARVRHRRTGCWCSRRNQIRTGPAEYPAIVSHRTPSDWEDLARREPYFPVLTDEGAREEAFLESGEADIALLLPAVASILGREVPLTSVLDFGCGAGRLTIPLARRAVHVVACDIAPSVLEHARKNVREAGLSNVTFVETRELAWRFDFICSLLVFQHIRPVDGYKLIRGLLRLLSPGGVAALQLTLEPSGGGLRRLARMRHKRGMRRVLPHRMQMPVWMQMNAYDERVVIRDVAAAGASPIGRFPTSDSDSVLVIGKDSALNSHAQTRVSVPHYGAK